MIVKVNDRRGGDDTFNVTLLPHDQVVLATANGAFMLYEEEGILRIRVNGIDRLVIELTGQSSLKLIQKIG